VIKPRIYQTQAISLARRALRTEKRALVVLATALGKMLTSAWIWHGFRKGPGIFLVHTTAILDHAMKEYRKVYGARAKFVLFDSPEVDISGADIVFSTLQMMDNHKRRFGKKYFKWMTVDETHHAQAKTYRRVITYFDCPRLGITATPDRKDLLDIREIFGQEVINISLEEAIARNWLPPIEYHVVTDDGFDERALERITQEVMEKGERLSLQEINRRIFIRARDKKVARAIEGHKVPTIVFCRSIDHAEHFRPFLRRAETYHSDWHRDTNRAVLDRLRAGRTRRVLSVNAFNEGIDVPDVGMVVFYRSTESETIFRQQLGRGMRRGKEKLIVLDFVGNVERILMLRDMVDTIDKIRKKKGGGGGGGTRKERLHVSGANFKFMFSDQVVDLIAVLERVNAEFYPTWQEAGAAAQVLGIVTQPQYVKGYKADPCLPSAPHQVYPDFPGYTVFLGRETQVLYPTWQKASTAAQALGLRRQPQYRKGYKADPRLPSAPERVYPDFPGYAVFLGVDFYPTWREAAAAALALGIEDKAQYQKGYKADPRLPSTPGSVYSNFPGYPVFLGKEARVGFYPTWQKASRAARSLGFGSRLQYQKGYKTDLRLPSAPDSVYSGFPGWRVFLSKN
jgi:superfamily II DNA or RNA helicase